MGTGAFTKVNGAQRKIVGAWGKVDGEWRKITNMYAKDSTWRDTWKNNFPTPAFLAYPSVITRGETITWTTQDVSGAAFELEYTYNSQEWQPAGIFSLNAGQFKISSSTTNTSFKMRVRAVDPVTHDKESGWMEGPFRSLTAQKLDMPTGLTYPSDITRGQRIKVSWDNQHNQIRYAVRVVYIESDGSEDYTLIYNSSGDDHVYHDVSESTRYARIKFIIDAYRVGYFASDRYRGDEVPLQKQALGLVPKIYNPKPYNGQTITINWDYLPHAQKYQLEVQYNDGSWSRIYWGSNRSYSYTVSSTANSIQFRVRGTASEYTDGPWRYGTQMDMALPPLKSSTWTAKDVDSWTTKYGGVWEQKDPYELWMFQGAWYQNGNKYGNYTGLAYFDYNSIRNTLSGRKIEKVEIYFYRLNRGGYTSGQAIKLHTHNVASRPASRPSLHYIQGPFSSFRRGEGKWITVKNEIAQRIVDGTAKGIALYREDEQGYLYVSGNVKIKVHYR